MNRTTHVIHTRRPRTKRVATKGRTLRTLRPAVTPEERKEICARIKEARKQAGFTQNSMAERLHVYQRTYQNYETDRVPWQRLREIAQITGVRWEWIVQGDRASDVGAQLDELRGQMAEVSEKLDELLNSRSAERVARAVTEAAEADDAPPARSPGEHRATESG